ncbi:MAG: hypothetical protein AAF587_00565 [Bacteroidota bacterium]
MKQWSFLLLISLLVISSCKTDDPIFELVPADEDPVIAVIAPTNTRLLNRSGDQITVSFQLADQEGLRLFRAIPKRYNANDSLLEDLDPIDFEISGQNQNFNFDLTVLPADPFDKYQYICYVIDTKGASAEANFWISILPDPTDPEPYDLLTYTADTLKNPGTKPEDMFKFGFNLSARQAVPSVGNQNLDTLTLQMDIAVDVANPLTIWEPFLWSPNNEQAGQDSVFVMTDATRFNYEEATYTTIYQAYFSDPNPAPQTPFLAAGQYIIVRLIKTPRPQFAVLRITEVIDDGRGGLFGVSDQVVFDYKISTP